MNATTDRKFAIRQPQDLPLAIAMNDDAVFLVERDRQPAAAESAPCPFTGAGETFRKKLQAVTVAKDGSSNGYTVATPGSPGDAIDSWNFSQPQARLLPK